MRIFWFFVFHRSRIQVLAEDARKAIACLEAVYRPNEFYLMTEEQNWRSN